MKAIDLQVDEESLALADAAALLDRLFMQILQEDLRYQHQSHLTLEEMSVPPGREARKILKRAQQHVFQRMESL